MYLISSWRQLGQVAPSWFKLILVGLFSPLVGQEFTEGFAIILVTGDPEQDILHPFTRVNVQCLATVHQGVDDGGTYRSIVVPTEQEVLPAQGQWPDGVLHEIVVNAEAAVVHVAAQARQQRKRITDGLPDAAVLRAAGCRFVHPLLELEDNRVGLFLAFLFQRIASNTGFLRLVFDVI